MDSLENWHDCVVCFEEHSCQVSWESNEPFLNGVVRYAAYPPPIVSSAADFDNFLTAFRLSLQTNGTVEYREIWHTYVVYFGEDSCQIASESNVPFPTDVDFTAYPRAMFGAHSQLTAQSIFSAFNQPQRSNGTYDSNEILHECVGYFEEDSSQISRQSNVPFSSRTKIRTEPSTRYFQHIFLSDVNRS